MESDLQTGSENNFQCFLLFMKREAGQEIGEKPIKLVWALGTDLTAARNVSFNINYIIKVVG
jgi:hypothetical protein